MKKKELIRCLAFLLLSALLLTAAALVFDRKYACDYFTRVRGFYNEPEDSMDVMFYGTSHMYCTVSPLALWKDSGSTPMCWPPSSSPSWPPITI